MIATTWTCISLFDGVGTAGPPLVVVPSGHPELAQGTISFIWAQTGQCSPVPVISAPALAASTIQMQGLSEYLVF